MVGPSATGSYSRARQLDVPSVVAKKARDKGSGEVAVGQSAPAASAEVAVQDLPVLLEQTRILTLEKYLTREMGRFVRLHG